MDDWYALNRFEKQIQAITQGFDVVSSNHNIMANSSLSYWGAYLGGNDNRVVCAPEKWFGIKGENPKDIYDEHWIKI